MAAEILDTLWNESTKQKRRVI